MPGFTMIELMVALAITVIVSSIAILSMTSALHDAKLRSACRTTASMLNYARSRAAAMNTSLRVVFNQDQTVEIDSSSVDQKNGVQWTLLTTSVGNRRTLPGGVAVTKLVKANGVENENWVEFSKLGQADQTLIQLTDNSGQNRYIIVDPITGRCRIEMNVDDTMFGSQTTK